MKRNGRTEAMFVIFLSQAARRLCFVTLALGGVGGAAHAQDTQAPTTVPGLDTYSLPAQPPRPTPLATPEPRIAPLPSPTPSATPVPTPVPLPSPATVAPPPVRVRPAPRPTPTSTPTPAARAPAPIATPPAVPATPGAQSSPAPISEPAPAATPEATSQPASHAAVPWVWWAAGVALAALIAGTVFYRRRRPREDDVEPSVPPLPRVAPEPRIAPPPPPEPVVLPRAHVEIELAVKRAGTNLLSAAVEYRVVLRNAGEVEARGVALDLRLFGVEPGLEPALEALFAAPLGQPVVARFDLAAGASAALEGTAMLSRGVMPPLAIQGAGEGMALFVPVMTANLHYGWEGGAGQTAASYVIGLDRGADAKLGPFRLDGAPRMYDRVRLLPFTVSRQT